MGGVHYFPPLPIEEVNRYGCFGSSISHRRYRMNKKEKKPFKFLHHHQTPYLGTFHIPGEFLVGLTIYMKIILMPRYKNVQGPEERAWHEQFWRGWKLSVKLVHNLRAIETVHHWKLVADMRSGNALRIDSHFEQEEEEKNMKTSAEKGDGQQDEQNQACIYHIC